MNDIEKYKLSVFHTDSLSICYDIRAKRLQIECAPDFATFYNVEKDNNKLERKSEKKGKA